MRILMAHNAYQQRGGEDIVFDHESTLLEKTGHEVTRFLMHNGHIQSLTSKISATASIFKNKHSISALMEIMLRHRPDIVHFHNFFPTLSPAALAAVAAQGIPVVQTLHNYRLICAGAMLLRDGSPCEQCVWHTRLPGIVHRCYRASAVGSTLVGAMGYYFKSILRRYPRLITLVALTESAKSKFVADGYSSDNIVIRGNFLPDPGEGQATRERRIVYVGRLSLEKGVDVLVKAAASFDGDVEIIGDGPQRQRLEAIAPKNVKFLGYLDSAQVFNHIKSATALAVPSLWYEGYPLVVLEAMATGTPVLASRIGSLAEIVLHERTGLLLSPGDAEAWSAGLSYLLNNPALSTALGRQARQRFLENHGEDIGLTTLIAIYEKAKNKKDLTP